MKARSGGFNVKYGLIALLALAGFYLFRVGTNSEMAGAGLQFLALIAGFVMFAAAAVMLFREYQVEPDDVTAVKQSGFAHFLFNSVRSAPLWLGARIYLGYEWFQAGWHKVIDPAWMNGDSLAGYWAGRIAIPETGRPAISYDVYREYIRFMHDSGWAPWFADIVAWGEVLIGVGLVLGALTGIAAFFGALMNMSFMLAGSASTNPVLFTLSVMLILAWRVAGLIGLDRWLLPALGAPWSPGALIHQPESGNIPGTHFPPTARPA